MLVTDRPVRALPVFLLLAAILTVVMANTSVPVAQVPSCSHALEETTYPQFGRATDNRSLPGELVLVVPEGSVGVLCVRYALPSSSPSRALSLTPTAGVGELTTFADGAREFTIRSSNQVVVTSKPSSLELTPGSSAAVSFSIQTASLGAGFYFLAIPGVCPAVPLAVGFAGDELSAQDFPSLGPVPCPSQSFATSIGIATGIQTTYLQY